MALSQAHRRIVMVTAVPHTSQEFEQELNALGEHLVTMGARAEHQVVRAMKALLDRDDAIADEVIAGDAAINTDENEIDAEALQLLARHQPVASDLRFIAMCLKAVIDIERIGDLAVNTARRAHELNRIWVPAWHSDLELLATSVTRALRAVLASLRDRNAEGAEQVLRETSHIERVYATLLAELLAYVATDPAKVTWVLPLTSVCRYLGRIGDHVRNLAGEVIYMVRAEHVRYVDA
jgi:phosphate transport system protein